jgi:hypothetical protein
MVLLQDLLEAVEVVQEFVVVPQTILSFQMVDHLPQEQDRLIH